MSSDDSLNAIKEIIKNSLPPTTDIAQINYEGPEIAIYTRNPKILEDNGNLLKNLAKKLRKRIVVRSDPSIRGDKEETAETIRNSVPEEAEITKITFDDNLGEVTIEAKKPGLVIGKLGANLKTIRVATSWRPVVVRTPPIDSKTVKIVRHMLKTERATQKEILLRIGKRIHRPLIFKDTKIKVTALGGFREVGRSCLLVQSNESAVLLDCGLNIGNQSDPFPLFDLPSFDIDQLDAVIVTHAHLDHSGMVPYLYKYDYDGPVYSTLPTRNLCVMLQLDYIQIAEREGKICPYKKIDVKSEVLHSIPLQYGEVTDIAPDIKLTLHNSGHILGGSLVHLHYGEGAHNLVYTGDYKFQKTRLLESASANFPRLETLITEATYGGKKDEMPSRHESEQDLINLINLTVERGGKILIPVLAVGRAQEIIIILEEMIAKKRIEAIPVYIDGLISEATAIHTTHPEYLNKELRDRIFHQGNNPFLSPYFTQVDSSGARQDIIEGEPCIIMATSGMLQGGPSVQYLRGMADEPNNSLLFVSYQVEGTLGRRIQKGFRDFQIQDARGRSQMVRMKMEVHTIEGFSGHSSRSQIMSFIRKVKPKPERVLTDHGEASKCVGLASVIHKRLKIDTRALVNGETIVLL
ncbi:MAG TPA: beta-CASP ribonuclease aCPSF1 [Candidatus Lokiarchaeia archaeon]|nr:beta-CASP ribonuclease aCPSF1 [Candidatus Lokiarchaeia archaeon]